MFFKRTVLVSLAALAILVLLVGCSSAGRQFTRAEHLERKGKVDEALSIYQRLAEQTPADNRLRRSQLFFRIGECFYRLDRIPEAFSAFQSAADAEPGNLPAHLRLGEFYLAAGAPERARDQAGWVLKSAPNDAEGLSLLGSAQAALGQTAAAREAYERVLKIDPKRVQVSVALADLYNNDNQVPQAKQVLRNATVADTSSATPWLALARLHEQEGEISEAEGAYRHAVALQDTPETNLRLAQFLQRTARISEAEQVLRRVDAQRPSQPTALPDFELLAGKAGPALDRYLAALMSRTKPQPPVQPDAGQVSSSAVQDRAVLATRLIEADLEVGESGPLKAAAVQRARHDLDQYRQDLDPATVAVLEAEIAISDSDLPRATAQATAAVALAPQSAPAHYVLGLAQYRAGSPAQAQVQWLAALQADSHFVPARLALTEQALASGDTRGAETYITGVVRDEPANLRALNLFSRVLLAEKRYGAAMLIAHRALAVDSSASEPHLVLGQVALEQHRLGEALVDFEQAVLLHPHSRGAIEGLTRVYKAGAITRPMLAKMEKVAAAPPASATLMEIAGRLYADHGWYADGERCLQAALRLDPQRTTAAAALAKAFVATGQLGAAADSASRTGGNSSALLAGVRAQERNNTQAAISNYERAVREGDHSGIAANNLAWLYAQQGTNLQRALQLAQEASSLAPEDPAVLDTVGVVHLRMRKYSEAIKTLEAARRIAGEKRSDSWLLAQIRHHLTEAYLRAGNTAAAALVSQSDADSR